MCIRDRSGTIAAPAFETTNEYAAPFAPLPHHCQPKRIHKFDPQPSNEGDDEVFRGIDYEVRAPVISGLACNRPGGVGEPAYENEYEYPAPFPQISHR